jgi:serine/threonine protein phosphatase PrpC
MSCATGYFSRAKEGGARSSGAGADSFLLEYSADICVAGVFDGHGRDGERASSDCMERVRSGMREFPSGCPPVQRLVSDLLSEDEASRTPMSGTTAALILHVGGGEVATVHVGDSTCAVFDVGGRKLFETPPHDLSNLRELRRLAEAGHTHTRGDRLGGYISTTRSIGMRRLKRKRLGGLLVPDPEVNTVKVEDRSFYVVAMSDGIRKAMTDSEIFRAVSTGEWPTREWRDDATAAYGLVVRSPPAQARSAAEDSLSQRNQSGS